MAKDNPETNPITIKPETASHVTGLFSWVPLLYCSPPGCPFPIKSLALSAQVSPRTIHFLVLDKSPVWGPGRGPPSSNKEIVSGCLFSRFWAFQRMAVNPGQNEAHPPDAAVSQKPQGVRRWAEVGEGAASHTPQKKLFGYLNTGLSNVNVHMNHQRILLKCTFLFSSGGWA